MIPNFITKLNASAAWVESEVERLAKQGAVGVVVDHDDWCPHLIGGCCSCDPDIVVVSEAEYQKRQIAQRKLEVCEKLKWVARKTGCHILFTENTEEWR